MGIGTYIRRAAVAAVTLSAVAALVPANANAAEGKAPPAQEWAFQGIFGQVDRASAQRGLQVYLEVCAGCHGLRLVAYRNLGELGFSEDEIKTIAAEYEVTDGPDDEGEMFQRPAKPSDKFVSPFPNDNAAKVANNGALPPDLSLLTKAVPHGPDYIYALLTGFSDPPADVEMTEGLNYNPYFPGEQIAMAPPLFEDGVEYTDGTQATVQQMAWDIVNFLQWAAEPEMNERKKLGWKVVLFLIVFSAIMYAAKRRMWSNLH